MKKLISLLTFVFLVSVFGCVGAENLVLDWDYPRSRHYVDKDSVKKLNDREREFVFYSETEQSQPPFKIEKSWRFCVIDCSNAKFYCKKQIYEKPKYGGKIEKTVVDYCCAQGIICKYDFDDPEYVVQQSFSLDKSSVGLCQYGVYAIKYESKRIYNTICD